MPRLQRKWQQNLCANRLRLRGPPLLTRPFGRLNSVIVNTLGSMNVTILSLSTSPRRRSFIWSAPPPFKWIELPPTPPPPVWILYLYIVPKCEVFLGDLRGYALPDQWSVSTRPTASHPRRISLYSNCIYDRNGLYWPKHLSHWPKRSNDGQNRSMIKLCSNRSCEWTRLISRRFTTSVARAGLRPRLQRRSITLSPNCTSSRSAASSWLAPISRKPLLSICARISPGATS